MPIVEWSSYDAIEPSPTAPTNTFAACHRTIFNQSVALFIERFRFSEHTPSEARRFTDGEAGSRAVGLFHRRFSRSGARSERSKRGHPTMKNVAACSIGSRSCPICSLLPQTMGGHTSSGVNTRGCLETETPQSSACAGAFSPRSSTDSRYSSASSAA